MSRPPAFRKSNPYLLFLSALVACQPDATSPLLEPSSDRPAVSATASATSGVVLVGAGDIAGSGSGDEETAQLLDQVVAADGASVTVFTAGDNAYPDGTPSNFTDYYEPTWGRHKARTRPSPGNHDYHTAGAAGYFDYFGANAGDPGVGYYGYDVGEWHIISLNSEISMSAGSAQEQWLRADLAATTKPCVLAYWHKPRFSSANHGSSTGPRALWQASWPVTTTPTSDSRCRIRTATPIKAEFASSWWAPVGGVCIALGPRSRTARCGTTAPLA